MIYPPRFTLADATRAHSQWGANCGPGAIAAIAGLTLDEVRPHMGEFERKGYTNPTLMLDVLGRLTRAGLIARWSQTERNWPSFGLVRVQWEGPWTRPGVPVRARYRHTHWVGAGYGNGDVAVFDINSLHSGSGWVSLSEWRGTVVPLILEECVPRADGRWHITHAIEVERRARVAA